MKAARLLPRLLIACAIVGIATACGGAPHVVTVRQMRLGRLRGTDESIPSEYLEIRGSIEALFWFPRVPVPRGATIARAHLQVRSAASSSSTPATIVLRAIPNTGALSSSNLFSRTGLLASTTSVTGPWVVNEVGDATVWDITSLVQAYVSRQSPAWDPGMAMLFGATTTREMRTVSTWAQLVISYCAENVSNSTVQLSTAISGVRAAGTISNSGGTVTDQTTSTGWTLCAETQARSILELAYSPIPPGAVVTRAVLSGFAEETSTSPGSVQVRVLVGSNANLVVSASTGRLGLPGMPLAAFLSTASVTWTFGPSSAYDLLTSPDLATLINEAVQNADYRIGNSFALLFERLPNTTTTRRLANHQNNLQLQVDYRLPRLNTQPFAMVLPPSAFRSQSPSAICTAPAPAFLAFKAVPHVGFQFSNLPYRSIVYTAAHLLAVREPGSSTSSTGHYPVQVTWGLEASFASAELVSASNCLAGARNMSLALPSPDLIPHTDSWTSQRYQSPSLLPLLNQISTTSSICE